MRRRILASMVLVTALAVAVFAIPLGVAAGRLYRGREVGRLEREATRAAGALPATGLHGADPIDVPVAASGVLVAIYDGQGRLVAGHGPPTGDTEVASALRGRVTDDHDGKWLAAAVPIHDEEQVVGAARAAVLWSVVASDTYMSWLAMAALGAVAVAMAAALAWWQSSRLSVPIEGVAKFAMRLGDGNFTARLNPSGIGEVDQAADAMNRTAARLGELVARERAFTADVSHQLNTPLTSLRLGLESALLTPDTDPEHAIRAALAEVDRVQATVTTLLSVARDAHAVDARSDASAVCTEVADRYRGGLASAGRPLRLDMSPDLGAVRCPPDVLREILTVLVENASRHGGGAVTITARSAGTGVVIGVADEGEGIRDGGSWVFERRSTSATGHGIGLPLARSLAEAHEARLQLTRAAPHPLFTLALPGSADGSAAV